MIVVAVLVAALAVVWVLEVVALVAAVVLVLVYQDQEFPVVQIESMVVD